MINKYIPANSFGKQRAGRQRRGNMRNDLYLPVPIDKLIAYQYAIGTVGQINSMEDTE